MIRNKAGLNLEDDRYRSGADIKQNIIMKRADIDDRLIGRP